MLFLGYSDLDSFRIRSLLFLSNLAFFVVIQKTVDGMYVLIIGFVFSNISSYSAKSMELDFDLQNHRYNPSSYGHVHQLEIDSQPWRNLAPSLT